MAPDLLLEAAHPFGISYLFPYQRLVITNVLDTEPEAIARQIVVLPTGAGKTLCFQLPARILPGLTVVIYPLLSLMADQLRRAQAADLPAVVLGGGQSRSERNGVWKSISSGELRLVLTNPETLCQESVLRRLAKVEISHLVIDEAHCVSEWGETFRSAYLELGRVIRELAPQTTMAFTATASPPVLDAVRSHLFGDEGAHLIQAVPDRPNIAYSVLHTPAKEFALRSLLAGGVGDTGSARDVGTAQNTGNAADALQTPALVFCRSRKRVETVARTLGEALGWDRVAAYHAGMGKEERTSIEQWFFSATDAVLVATCAYGMPYVSYINESCKGAFSRYHDRIYGTNTPSPRDGTRSPVSPGRFTDLHCWLCGSMIKRRCPEPYCLYFWPVLCWDVCCRISPMIWMSP